MCFGNSAADAAKKEARLAREQEDARQAQIRAGRANIDNTFSQFNDDFFANQRQAFQDFAMPQLDNQFQDASKELTFDLARSGLLNSSVRGEQSSRLQQLYDENRQQVDNEALSREQAARNNVEGARSNLVSMLQATGDAQGAANQALSRAAMLSQPEPFSPLGQLFTTFTGNLGTQAAMERAASVSGGRFTPRYNTGLFGVPSSAAVTTR